MKGFLVCQGAQSRKTDVTSRKSGFVLSPGTIKTALPGMDREVKENYQVVIQAKDMAGQMGGLSGTTTVSITLSDVNDSPPRFANRKSRLQRASACRLA